MPQIKGGVFVQAESEVSAVNMVYGSAGCGVRTMTSSSSPGVSLKAEGISYLAGADLPAVIVNIQRGGPGLGTIQPSQADYFQAVKACGHGDYKMIVLAPNTIQEMADLTYKSFDLADKYRMTVMILADGTMGQMMEAVTLNYPAPKKVDKPWAVTGTEKKRGQNCINSLFLYAEELEEAVVTRFERYKVVEKNEVMVEEYLMDDAEICVTGYGISSRVALSAVNLARARGIKAGLLRPITVWPFPAANFKKAAAKCKAIVSVEMSMGQMIEDVRAAIEYKIPVYPCNKTGGVIPAPEYILNKIIEVAGGAK
jgi:2-oxoglutarate ferredoxin oxidoreductase subunit alpha